MRTDHAPPTRPEGQPIGGPTPPDVPKGATGPPQGPRSGLLARPVAWRRREFFRARNHHPHPRDASCARRTRAAPLGREAAGAGGAPSDPQAA